MLNPTPNGVHLKEVSRRWPSAYPLDSLCEVNTAVPEGRRGEPFQRTHELMKALVKVVCLASFAKRSQSPYESPVLVLRLVLNECLGH